MCARITRRQNGSLVTLEGRPRASVAAQVVASVSLAIGAAGVGAQSSSEQGRQQPAVLTGVVLKPDGSGPVAGAAVSLRVAGSEVAAVNTNERGEFRISVAPGTYDLYLRQNVFFGARILAVNLHSDEQTVQSVKTHFWYADHEDGGASSFTTMGVMVSTISYSFRGAVTHPWSYQNI